VLARPATAWSARSPSRTSRARTPGGCAVGTLAPVPAWTLRARLPVCCAVSTPGQSRIGKPAWRLDGRMRARRLDGCTHHNVTRRPLRGNSTSDRTVIGTPARATETALGRPPRRRCVGATGFVGSTAARQCSALIARVGTDLHGRPMDITTPRRRGTRSRPPDSA
jgi:hypothetical protein